MVVNVTIHKATNFLQLLKKKEKAGNLINSSVSLRRHVEVS
jgi:hypothetical protein